MEITLSCGLSLMGWWIPYMSDVRNMTDIFEDRWHPLIIILGCFNTGMEVMAFFLFAVLRCRGKKKKKKKKKRRNCRREKWFWIPCSGCGRGVFLSVLFSVLPRYLRLMHLSAVFTLRRFMLGNTGILKTAAGKIIPSLLTLDDEDFTFTADKLQDHLSGSTVGFIYWMKLVSYW